MSHQKETPPEGGVITISDPKSGLTATVPRRFDLGELTLRGMVLLSFDGTLFALTPDFARNVAKGLTDVAEMLEKRSALHQ